MKKFLLFLFAPFLAFGLVSCSFADGNTDNTYPGETDPYPEYRNHVFIGPRGGGDCDSLTGDVLITVVFADEPDSAWTDADMEEYKRGLDAATVKLYADATKYGVSLNIRFQYLRGKADSASTFTNYESWSSQVLRSAGLPEKEQVIPQLKKTHSVKEAPVLFVVNRGGRAFARTHATPDGMEYAILHRTEADYRHELMHMFGARDYYYPDEAEELAKKYFPSSIMNTADGEAVIDPLTAYHIGWTDTLSPQAKSFLDETAWITSAYVTSSVSQETRSGYATVEDANGSYTGYFLEGMYHGQGKYVWKTGGVFEGTFEYGTATYGTLTWAGGASYTGSFRNWKMHGQGKYTWPSGDWYEGTFVDDSFTGYGTAYWVGGTRYVGEFLNWKLHGQGTCTFPDGSVQTGRWENDRFLG